VRAAEILRHCAVSHNFPLFKHLKALVFWQPVLGLVFDSCAPMKSWLRFRNYKSNLNVALAAWSVRLQGSSKP
jgi:hypothetical protein